MVFRDCRVYSKAGRYENCLILLICLCVRPPQSNNSNLTDAQQSLVSLVCVFGIKF